MKHAAAVVAMFALLALPAMAQHGGARGGFGGGHAASGGFGGHGGFGGGFASHGGFGGGFAAPHFGGFASRGPSFAPRSGGYAARYGSFSPRFGGYAPQRFMGYGRTSYAPRSGAFTSRMPYRGNGYNRLGNASSRYDGNRYGDHGRGRHSPHHRPNYNGFDGLPYAYNYGAWPWYPYDIDPWLFAPDWDESDDSGNTSESSAQADNSDYVPAPYPDYGETAPAPYGYQGDAPPPYPEPSQNANQAEPQTTSPRRSYAPTDSSSASELQPSLTVIFNDGRPPEKIHNYMLTPTTLTVLDRKYQQIPVGQIDIAATQAANRADGVSFQVPGLKN